MLRLLKELLRPAYNLIRNPEYREYIRLLGRLDLGKRRCRQKICCFNYFFEIPDALSFAHQIKDIFLDKIYLFHSTNKVPVIFDCGANIGVSCLYFKSKYPQARIIAFEADPMIADFLKNNLVNNGYANVSIIRKAVWIHNDGIEFYSTGDDAGSLFGTGEMIKIDSVRLKEVLEKEPYIDLLKMGIEGAEIEVIQDCKDVLSRIFHLFIEFHSQAGKRQELEALLAILTNQGFQYFLQSISERKSPFVNRQEDSAMDFQCNIFAYRK